MDTQEGSGLRSGCHPRCRTRVRHTPSTPGRLLSRHSSSRKACCTESSACTPTLRTCGAPSLQVLADGAFSISLLWSMTWTIFGRACRAALFPCRAACAQERRLRHLAPLLHRVCCSFLMVRVFSLLLRHPHMFSLRLYDAS